MLPMSTRAIYVDNLLLDFCCQGYAIFVCTLRHLKRLLQCVPVYMQKHQGIEVATC